MFTKTLYSKLFAYRSTSSRASSRTCSTKASTFSTRLNMKTKFMSLWDKMMLRKCYVIECINKLLKNKVNFVHSRHRSVLNFLMNLCSALTAYCFLENSLVHSPYTLRRAANWRCSKQILIPTCISATFCT